MIGFLSGIVQKLAKSILVDVNGVGYRVQVAQNLMASLPDGQAAKFFIYTHVKKDALDLYGFTTEKDLALFELVLSVSGVGPKIALTIVDAGSERLVGAVQNAEVSFFKSIPRVGKKLAQKIIIELSSKLGGLKDLDLEPLSAKEQDVLEGLKNLGFDEDHAHQVLKNIDKQQPVETMLKEAVKNLSKV